MHMITRQGTYELMIKMVNWENDMETVVYDKFYIDGREEKYRLTIGRYNLMDYLQLKMELLTVSILYPAC